MSLNDKLLQYISCGGWEVAEMWDEEGGDGEDRVVPSGPEFFPVIIFRHFLLKTNLA